MKLFFKNLVFTVVVPGSVGVLLPYRITNGASAREGVSGALSLVLFAVAVSIYAWSVYAFAVAGHGTPAPIDEPRTLVLRGPYRYSRNPMYLAVCSALAGWIVRYPGAGLILYGVSVAVLMVLFVTRYEEPHLSRRFGREYETYRWRVPRWLPRIGPGPHL
jgi:protein-S-isoprenylcysteine O-methyltransferase Ste14